MTAEWAKKWPCEEIWVGAEAPLSCAAACPRVDLAAAARDPRAAPDPVRGRRAGLRGGAGRRPGRARRRQGALGRRRRPAGARCRHGRRLRRRGDRQAGRRGRGRRGCSRVSAGVTHDVVSGLCLRTEQWEELHSETTRVTFRRLTPSERDRYVAAGEWEGRAGAYAIQGLGATLVERVGGDYPERRRPAGQPCSSGCSRRAFPTSTSRPPAARSRRRRAPTRPAAGARHAPASTRAARTVAITTDDERTASTEAALPCRSASRASRERAQVGDAARRSTATPSSRRIARAPTSGG